MDEHERQVGRWHGIGRTGVYVLLLGAGAVFVLRHHEALMRVWREQAFTFLGAMAFMVLATVLQAHNFLAFLEDRRTLRAREFAPVWALSVLVNYVLPLQAGIGVRLGYLKRCGLTLTGGVLATVRMSATSVWIATFGLGLGLITWRPARAWPAAVALCGMAVVAVFARRASAQVLGRIGQPAWLARHRDVLRRALAAVSTRGIAGVIAQYALSTLLLDWVYARFDATLSWAQVLVMSCAVSVSSLVALLPGNFGVLEGIYLAGGQTGGLNLVQAAALAGLLRVAHIAANALFALAGLLRGAWRS